MPRRSPRELLVRVLGSVCVERGGERIALPPSKKTRALLGYLMVEGREQTREHLCSLFWDLPDDPRGALRWSLSRLRPLLDDASCGRVIADRERVRIDLAGAQLDLKIAQSLRLPDAGVGELQAVAELFRGDLLEGLELCDAYRFQAWCTARREEARKLHAQVLRALADRLAPEPEEALAPARKLVELLPADESAHRAVIELLGKLGRQKEAIAQYDALREILRATSGARPSAAIEHLRRSLGTETRSVPSARAAPPAPPAAPLIGRKEERGSRRLPPRCCSSASPGLGRPGSWKRSPGARPAWCFRGAATKRSRRVLTAASSRRCGPPALPHRRETSSGAISARCSRSWPRRPKGWIGRASSTPSRPCCAIARPSCSCSTTCTGSTKARRHWRTT